MPLSDKGKETPTLADLALRETLRNPHKARVLPSCRAALLAAKRFVLDDDASGFLADLSCANFPTTKKSILAMEASRVLARLPHAVIWIEYSPPAYNKRAKTYPFVKTSLAKNPYPEEDDVVPKCGWLIRQHPRVETAVRATVMCELQGRAHMLPFDLAWTTDDGLISDIHKGPTMPTEEVMFWMSERATGIFGYHSKCIGYLRNGMSRGDVATKGESEIIDEFAGEVRRMITLLAAINDVPVGARHVIPSHGYIAAGRYRKFVDHTVISIVLPKGRTPTAAARAAIAASRRRAHEVRGHYRRNWRHEGERLWIKPHVRGDASLGWVSHDYKVQHEEAT